MSDTLAAVTDDGVLLARNSDRDPNESQHLSWHPAADHPHGAEVATTASAIGQVRHTHAVLLSRPWWAWGAETGANEHGVVIGSQAVATRRTGARRGGGSLLGTDLLRLGLERAACRREAVEVLVGLLEKHGQGGVGSRARPARDSSFLVADRDGVTLLETAGRRWETEEVERARSISDGLTIPGLAERYADRARGRLAACAARRERTAAWAGRASDPAGFMAALRDHGGKRPGAPHYRMSNGALSGACAHAGGVLTSAQTTSSWVADLRPGRPGMAGADGEAATHWVTGTAAPCTSVFWPAAVGVPVDVDAAGEPGGPAGPEDPGRPEGAALQPPADRHDPAYLWWRHERLHRTALRDPERTLGPLATGREALEELWLEGTPTSREALELAGAWRGAALEGLLALEPADTRPVRVATQWRRWHARAGSPGWAQLTREAS